MQVLLRVTLIKEFLVCNALVRQPTGITLPYLDICMPDYGKMLDARKEFRYKKADRWRFRILKETKFV